jgi:hypothetical protein
MSLGISCIKFSAKQSATSSGSLFPGVIIKGCRFHLGQAWWRKIQNLGLAKEYKKRGSEVSKWLHHFFGLAFLEPDEVADCFAENLIQDMPSDMKVEAFADYVLSTLLLTAAEFVLLILR